METTTRANELIALLDRYLFLRGDTLVSCPDINAARSGPTEEVPTALDPDIPVALQVYPVVPLLSHLSSLDDERAEMAGIHSRLRVLIPDIGVVAVAKGIVGGWYADLVIPGAEQQQKYMQKDLPNMLLQLRQAEARKEDAKVPMFSFQLVLGLREDGKVSELKM